MTNERYKVTVLLVFVLVLVISGGTAASVVFGPNPTLLYSSLIDSSTFGLKETRDNVALLIWWGSIGFVAIVTWLIHHQGSVDNKRAVLSKIPAWISGVLGILAVGILAANYVLDLDRRYTDNYPRFAPIELSIGTVLAATFFVFVWYAKRISRKFHFVTGIIVSLYMLGVALQSPRSLRDFYHSSFSMNEIAAQSAGLFSLANFIPQYSSLLGLPITPLADLSHGRSALVTVTWLLFLQIVCLAIPLLLTRLISGWIYVIPAAFLVSAMSLSSSSHQDIGSITGYFAAFPIRTLLPSLLLLILVLMSKREPTRAFQQAAPVGSGIIAGLAALNNPDFGIPALIAGLLTLYFLVSRDHKIQEALVYLVSGTGVFLLYDLFGRLSGNTVVWTDYLLFQQIFGSVGVGKETMAVGGLHVSYVVFFGIGLILAITAHRRAVESDSLAIRMTSVFLGFTSTWAIGTLPYFVGRSYTSTLFGHNFQFALVAIAVLNYLVIDYRYLLDLQKNLQLIRIFAVLLVLPLVFMTSLITRLPNPSVVLSNIRNTGDINPDFDGLTKDVLKLAELTTDGSSNIEIVQLVVMSNLVELDTGIDAGLVVSHPAYLYASPVLMDRQCDFLEDVQPNFVIEMNWDLSIANTGQCVEFFAFEELSSTTGELGLRLLRITSKTR